MKFYKRSLHAKIKGVPKSLSETTLHFLQFQTTELFYRCGHYPKSLCQSLKSLVERRYLASKTLGTVSDKLAIWVVFKTYFTLGFGCSLIQFPSSAVNKKNTTLPEYQAYKQVSPSKMMGRQRWMSESTTEVYTS
jgi:hypothetical protein